MKELSIERMEVVSGLGWWSKTDECVGKFHNLTNSNIANIAIIAVFDVVTLGGYTVGSIGVCATYGLFAK